VQFAGDAIPLGNDRVLLLRLAEAGRAHGNRGKVGQRPEERALSLGEGDAVVRMTHSSPRKPSAPRSGRAIITADGPSCWTGQAGLWCAASPAGAGWARRQVGAVVGHRQAVRPVVSVAVGARVRQAGDGAVGAKQLAGVAGDRVEQLAQLCPPVSWRATP